MPELERQISSLILATDITRQQEFLTKFKVCYACSNQGMYSVYARMCTSLQSAHFVCWLGFFFLFTQGISFLHCYT